MGNKLNKGSEHTFLINTNETEKKEFVWKLRYTSVYNKLKENLKSHGMTSCNLIISTDKTRSKKAKKSCEKIVKMTTFALKPFIASKKYINLTYSDLSSASSVIRRSIAIVNKKKTHCILLMICNKCIKYDNEMISALNKSKFYPLSIICVRMNKKENESIEYIYEHVSKNNNFLFFFFDDLMKQCGGNEVEFTRVMLTKMILQYRKKNKFENKVI